VEGIIRFLPLRGLDGQMRLEVQYPPDATEFGPLTRVERAVYKVKPGQEVKVDWGKNPAGAQRWVVLKVEMEPRLIDQHKDLVPRLLTAVSRANKKEVAAAVSEALLALGADAVPCLLKELRNKDSQLRAQAAKLLGVLAANGKVPAEAVPALLEATADEDNNVAGEAAIALSNLIKAGR
jgi:hypothetical protein